MIDPWAWLQNRDDPETIKYLEAENTFANAWFANGQPTVDELFEEIKSRVVETDMSVPVRHGDWWYVSRTQEGLAYPVHCRGKSRETATQSVLLDENRMTSPRLAASVALLRRDLQDLA